MTPRALSAELHSGRIRPAYLLAGDEALLRDEALLAIRQAVLGDGPADFDLERLEGEKLRFGELLDAVRSLPIMAPRRLVVLREPEGRRRGGGGELIERLAEVVSLLCEEDTTVLAVLADKVDKRSRWVKAFREPALLVDCGAPRGPKALTGFVREEAERLGVALGPGAAEDLAEAVGPQLLLLRQELEKASLLAGPGGKLTRDIVAQSCTQLASAPIWDLTDAIGEGRSADAVGVLEHLLVAGSAPQALLGSLANHFRKLARACHGGELSGHPFAVRKLTRQAARYSQARILSCLQAIHEVDEILKGAGNVAPRIALERLVLGLSA